MKPDYTGLLKPPPARSEILPNLWQGARPVTYIGYDLVVSCEEYLARKPSQGYMGALIHLPMRDEDDFKIPQLAAHVGCLVADVVQDGGVALVHCSGGLNRSSLVTAWAVVNIADVSPKEAVALIRRNRDPYCLCNRAFERWVTGEVLPTAETSAFRAQASAADGEGAANSDAVAES